MIYDKEWKRYKRTNFLHPKGLITFSAHKPTKQPQSILDCIMDQIRYFTNNIHGVKYIWEKDSRWSVKLFWLLVVSAAVFICFIMYMSLSCQTSKQQLKTVVGDSKMPICSINFPAVALCSWSHVNWMRYKAAEQRFLPANASNKTKLMFYDILKALEKLELPKLESLELLRNNTFDSDINNICLQDLINFVAFRCEELFVECYYDDTEYDCCKIFVGERTARGYCMVFNSMVSEESQKKQINDKFYPWKNRQAGEGTGLRFTLQYDKKFHRPDEKIEFIMHVMVKEAEMWSEPSTNLFLPNFKTYLAITPIISETLPNTRRLSPQSRSCLFPDEKSERYDRIEGLTFNKVNCFTKCQQTVLIKVCNCTLPMFFPPADVRDCSVADLECVYVNRDILTYIKSPVQDEYIRDTRSSFICDCVDSCTTLVFLTSLRANRLPNPNASYPKIEGDIYIGQSVLTKYETRLYTTTFDLIAKFGAILGLCLGASVSSLAEIVYGTLKIIVLFLFGIIFQKKVKPYSKNRLSQKQKPSKITLQQN